MDRAMVDDRPIGIAGAHPFLRLAVLLAVLVAALIPPPSARADGSLVIGGRGDFSGLRARWFEWESQLAEGEFQGVGEINEEILQQAERLGVERLTELSLAAVGAARRFEAEGAPDKARLAWESALQFDPTSPDVELAWADSLMAAGSPARALTHYVIGLRKVLSNRIPRQSLQASLAVVAILAALAAVLMIWVSLLLNHLGSYLHDASERLEERLGAWGARVLALGILFLPLLLSFSPLYAVLFSLTLLWGYGRPSEKLMVLIAQLIILLAPAILLGGAGHARTIRGSIYVGAVDLAERRYDPGVVERLEILKDSNPADAELWYLLGSLHRDLGENDRAQAYFRRAFELDGNLVEAALNLGVLYYLEGDLAQSVTEFERVLSVDPDFPEAHFNLSIALNEMSQFDEGSRHLQMAKDLAPSRTSSWIAANEIQKTDFAIERARRKSAAVEGDVNQELKQYLLNPLTLFGVVALLLAPVLGLVRLRMGGFAGGCVKCGRTFCSRCKASTESSIYCSQCVHIFLKKQGVAIDTKMAKVEEVKRWTQQVENRRRWSSLLLPGVAQVVSGRPIRGFLLALAFFLSIVAALFAGELFRPVVVETEFFRFLSYLFIALAFLAWLAANLRVVFRPRVQGG